MILYFSLPVASSLVRVKMRGLVWSLAIFLTERKNVEMVISVLFFATLFHLTFLVVSQRPCLEEKGLVHRNAEKETEQNNVQFSDF